jgi:hypothetical protein
MPKKLKLTGLKVYVNALVMIRKGQVAMFSPDVEAKVMEVGRFNAEREFIPYFTVVGDDTPVDHDLSGENLVPEAVVTPAPVPEAKRLMPKFTPPVKAPVQRRARSAA